MFYFQLQGVMDHVDAAPSTTERSERVQPAEVEVLAAIAARAAAQAGAENFPVAMRVLPRHVRTELTHIYSYARFVDDIGDEAPGARGALLDAIEEQVRALPSHAASCAPVNDMRGLVVQRGMPLDPMLKLIAANRMDQIRPRYATFEELLDYCALSAAPVGDMVLHLAGAATAPNLADSASVCAALQVLEHCQDVREDALAGRVYLAGADLDAAGVPVDALRASSTSPALRSVVALHAGRARELLEAGRPLVRRLRGWARLAVSGYVAGGLATADALDAAGHDVLASAIRPSRGRTVRHAARLFAAGRA
jgi:squalene synthase HpnC